MTLEEFLAKQKLSPGKALEVHIMVGTARRLEAMIRDRAHLHYTHASLLEGKARKELNLRADELCIMARKIRDRLTQDVEELLEEAGSPN